MIGKLLRTARNLLPGIKQDTVTTRPDISDIGPDYRLKGESQQDYKTRLKQQRKKLKTYLRGEAKPIGTREGKKIARAARKALKRLRKESK